MKKNKGKDPQGRKWQITVNNPLSKNLDHEQIKIKLNELSTVVYWCMSDEKGLEEETPHTTIFVASHSPIRFSTLKRLFDTAHLERANGTAEENRDYIAKTGKWEGTDKAKTSIQGTYEEWGELPQEHPRGGRGIEAVIIERIQDGATNAEILLEFPDYLRGMRDVEYVRQSLKAEEYRNKWRDLETVYIWGSTGTGKTRSVMDEYGYSNVYAVNNYKHPFDLYFGENVMLFDEFNSGINIQSMNNYLDGYPIALPARYNNKQACYEKVYIISNLDLRQQYKNVQQQDPDVWAAFLRRIHKVVRFHPDGTRREHLTKDYFTNDGNSSAFIRLPTGTPTPFDE